MSLFIKSAKFQSEDPTFTNTWELRPLLENMLLVVYVKHGDALWFSLHFCRLFIRPCRLRRCLLPCLFVYLFTSKVAFLGHSRVGKDGGVCARACWLVYFWRRTPFPTISFQIGHYFPISHVCRQSIKRDILLPCMGLREGREPHSFLNCHFFAFLGMQVGGNVCSLDRLFHACLMMSKEYIHMEESSALELYDTRFPSSFLLGPLIWAFFYYLYGECTFDADMGSSTIGREGGRR